MNMIFDRTMEDVDKARRTLKKIQNYEQITEEEKESLKRGFLTEETLSRILSKISYLVDSLKELGYYDIILSKLVTFTITEFVGDYGVHGTFTVEPNTMWRDWLDTNPFNDKDLIGVTDDEIILRPYGYYLYDSSGILVLSSDYIKSDTYTFNDPFLNPISYSASQNDIQTKEFFTIWDFESIIKNLQEIKKGFYSNRNMPSNILPKFHYVQINNIEKTIYELENIIYDIIENFKICGTFECGGE